MSFWCCYRPYQGLSRYKPEKFNRRVLSKLVFRLLERFNVDPGMGYCNILWSFLSIIKNKANLSSSMFIKESLLSFILGNFRV